MFVCYSLFYASFVALNLAVPTSMEKTVLAGMNLATVFGFTLIVVALLQALVYDSLCRGQEARLADPAGEGGDSKNGNRNLHRVRAVCAGPVVLSG
jgi:hypothetical protein